MTCTQSDIDIFKKITKKAQNIADRWAKLIGYGSASNVYVNYHNDTINFRAQPYSSGYNKPCSITINYLKDDSTLESDAQKQYDEDCRKEKEKNERIRFLKSTPEVQEYRDLTNENGFQRQFSTDIII